MLSLRNPSWHQGGSSVWVTGTCIEFNRKARRRTNLFGSTEILFLKKLSVPHIQPQFFIIKMWIHVTVCQSEFVQLQSNSCWHHWVKEADAASSPGNHILSPIPSLCWGYQEHQEWPLEKSLERRDLVLSILFSLNLLLCYFFRQATDSIFSVKFSSAATPNTKPKKNFGPKF